MPGILSIVIRSAAAFLVLLMLTRLMGKKQISQLTFFDYVVGISIGAIAGSTSVDKSLTVYEGLSSLVVWSLCAMILGYATMKAYKVRKLVNGNPVILIKQGEVQEANLRKERLSINDVLQLLRQKNVFNVADVEFAVMETDGEVSVMKKPERDPITPGRLGLQMVPPSLPQLVIMDGRVVDQTLATMGRDEAWLIGELTKLGIDHTHDVFLAQVGSDGELYVDRYIDEANPPQPKSKPLVLASLKKAQADLEMYALQTDKARMQQVYAGHAKAIGSLIQAVTPYLIET